MRIDFLVVRRLGHVDRFGTLVDENWKGLQNFSAVAGYRYQSLCKNMFQMLEGVKIQQKLFQTHGESQTLYKTVEIFLLFFLTKFLPVTAFFASPTARSSFQSSVALGAMTSMTTSTNNAFRCITYCRRPFLFTVGNSLSTLAINNDKLLLKS